MPPSVLIVAKAPLPGRSKTRLTPPLTPEQAADLQRRLLLDTLDACRAEIPATGLLHADASEARALADLAGADVPLVLQKGRGLEEALVHGMRALVGNGPGVLVSSDIPGLPSGALRRAFAALDGGADVVLGPALDGGYWLIAMREPHPEPFHAIPWSTPAVYATTVARCGAAGLRVAALEPWRDLDTAADLGASLAELDPAVAPRTAAALRALADAGVVAAGAPSVTLASAELLADSPWRAAIQDSLRTRDGGLVSYAYLAVPRAVFIVPITVEGEIVLVRQYRHPIRDWTLEVPAGTADEHETPLEAAKRELEEETGGRASHWQRLSTFYSSSAHLSLRSDVLLATGVTLDAPRPDAGEELSVVRVPAAEAIRDARTGRVREGQTALAILLAAERLELQGGSRDRRLLSTGDPAGQA